MRAVRGRRIARRLRHERSQRLASRRDRQVSNAAVNGETPWWWLGSGALASRWHAAVPRWMQHRAGPKYRCAAGWPSRGDPPCTSRRVGPRGGNTRALASSHQASFDRHALRARDLSTGQVGSHASDDRIGSGLRNESCSGKRKIKEKPVPLTGRQVEQAVAVAGLP